VLVLTYKTATKEYDVSAGDKKRYAFVSDTSIENLASADIFANNYFETNNQIKKQTQIIVNQNYPIENIKV
jgi:hypothetical protein